MYYVYLIKSQKDKSLYVGSTNDLKRRLIEHNSGKSFATKNKTPFELIYYEAYKVEADARRREHQLKQHAQGLVALKGRLKDSLA